LYPTLLFSFIPWPSPLWGPAHQGIQFLASAGHGYGSWGVGAAMAWQHQTCFSAGKHAHSSMPSWVPCSRNHSWRVLGMHPDGAPTVQAPDLGLLWGARQGTNNSEKSQSSPREEPKRCHGFLFVPNLAKLCKSEPTYPHSLLMQESKDMREKEYRA
jgi:hypothetical protein